jgi:hypothetical protein
MPAFGFYFWHVTGLNIDNITLQSKQTDARPPMIFEQVKAVRLNGKAIGLQGHKSSGNQRLALKQSDLLP